MPVCEGTLPLVFKLQRKLRSASGLTHNNGKAAQNLSPNPATVLGQNSSSCAEERHPEIQGGAVQGNALQSGILECPELSESPEKAAPPCQG